MKRILATILSVMLVATLAISGTVAYLTDDESAVNVMTVGKVNVRLHEDQRVLKDGKPTPDGVLVPFEDDKNLMPLVEAGAEDGWGLSLDENYVDKIVRVENIGESDAYVRVFIAIPSALEKNFGGEGEDKTPLHWDLGDKFNAVLADTNSVNDFAVQFGSGKPEPIAKDYKMKYQDEPEQEYNVYCFVYQKNDGVLVADDDGEDMTTAVMVGFYLDSEVDYYDEDNTYYFGKKGVEGNKINYDLNEDVIIPVYVQAIQAEGFETSDDAFATMPKNPWAATEEEEDEFNVNVPGEMGETTEIIGYAVSNNEELAAAIAAGETEIYLKPGTYNMPAEAKGKTLTISGTEDTVIEVKPAGQGEANGQLDYSLDGSNVTFNGVTIKTNNATYAGYARLNATYNNCVMKNCYCLNGNSEFNNCVLNVSGNQYNIWTWGAPTATFNGCTFNSDGKAMLLYGTADTKLTVDNCTFNDSGVLPDQKAAIEIGNDYGTSYELIVNNTTVNGYEINDTGINTGTTLWGNKNSMGTDKLNVVVDGVDVY